MNITKKLLIKPRFLSRVLTLTPLSLLFFSCENSEVIALSNFLQTPLLILVIILSICMLVLLAVLFHRSHYEKKKLEDVVQKRTSDLVRAQHELETAQKNERDAVVKRSAFLANMSNEIRTPMNSIIGFADLALDDEIPAKTRDYIEKIHLNTEWLFQIINDVFDISKFESGKMELDKVPFSLQELLESCRAFVIPKAVEKGIMLHFYAEPSAGKMPLGDPARLRQVLVNLLSNAVKFTNTGMVKLSVSIISKTDKTLSMHFEVKDSGIGMTPGQIDKIFDPFAQFDSVFARQFGGTGLGLAITKNIIQMMDGKLLVESVHGVGSKFSFDLVFETIEITEEEKLDKKAPLVEIDKPLFEGEVLLCEDNAMNQLVLCEHLARVGIKAVVAGNGKIGLDFINERIRKGIKQFDLIFMDMHMPVMDGLEATAEIVKLNIGIPIVALTANIMLDDMEIYKDSGMNDCIGKPFTSQELWHCLLKYFKPSSAMPPSSASQPSSATQPSSASQLGNNDDMAKS